MTNIEQAAELFRQVIDQAAAVTEQYETLLKMYQGMAQLVQSLTANQELQQRILASLAERVKKLETASLLSHRNN